MKGLIYLTMMLTTLRCGEAISETEKEPNDVIVINNEPAVLQCRAASAMRIHFQCNGGEWTCPDHIESLNVKTCLRIVTMNGNVTRNQVENYSGRELAWTVPVTQIKKQMAYMEVALNAGCNTWSECSCTGPARIIRTWSDSQPQIGGLPSQGRPTQRSQDCPPCGWNAVLYSVYAEYIMNAGYASCTVTGTAVTVLVGALYSYFTWRKKCGRVGGTCTVVVSAESSNWEAGVGTPTQMAAPPDNGQEDQPHSEYRSPWKGRLRRRK